MATSMVIGIVVISVIFSLVLYILMATGMMFAYKKANYRYPWLAYIPIAQYWPYLKVIRVNRWNIIWMVLPGALMPFQHFGIVAVIIALVADIVATILGIWWSVRFYKAFGMNPHRLWWLLLPIVGVILAIIFQLQIGFSKKYQYKYA